MKDVNVANDHEKVTFHEILVKKCQGELKVQTGYLDLLDMNKLSDQMTFAQSKIAEQEIMNEFAKHETTYLRRSIAFTRLVKHLYDFDFITPLMIHSWIKQILEKKSDKALEFLCMLLKVLGQTFEADTKVWLIASKHSSDSPELSDLSVYMKELENLVQEKKTSLKVRFMMMVVIKLYKNRWRKRDINTINDSNCENFPRDLLTETDETIDGNVQYTSTNDMEITLAVNSNGDLNLAKKQRT